MSWQNYLLALRCTADPKRPAVKREPKPEKEPAPLYLWQAHVHGTFITAEARTRSEARGFMKRELGHALPPGTRVELM